VPLYEGSGIFDIARFRALKAQEDERARKEAEERRKAELAARRRAQPEEKIAPQVGFQEAVSSSTADVVVCGGSAGCGKTYVCTLEACRDAIDVPGFAAVFFRRSFPQIMTPGGLWAEMAKLYPRLGAKRNLNDKEWKWPRGGIVKCAHLEHEDTVIGWHGSQVPLIIFDELTTFTAKQFWYMLSRNRSNVVDRQGRRIRARVLATCNPDADSWVAELLAWWIEQDPDSPNYGFPIAARAGKLRYFTRWDDKIIWGDTRAEVLAAAPPGVQRDDIRSLTFIPGRLEENKKGDPRYRGQLMALDRVTRKRLLDGNWKARHNAGEVFREEEARMLDAVPTDVIEWVRRWDLAATEPSEQNKDPDWTCGVLMGRRPGGRYVVADVRFARKRSDDVRKLILETAAADAATYGRTRPLRIGLPQDPGQAGKDQIAGFTMLLAGYSVYGDREARSKLDRATAKDPNIDLGARAEPFSAQWQRGNIDVVVGPWNAEYFSQMEGFPGKGVHDDAVDASVGAFAKIAKASSMWDPAVYGMATAAE